MEKDKSIEILFAQWSASLKDRDRSSKSYRPNFEDLFFSWKDLDISFNDLYEIWLPKAIKAHQPSTGVVRGTYKKLKSMVRDLDKSEKEFTEEWNKSIEDTATSIFFEFFQPPKTDDDGEPKIYNNMSAKEYSAQRRYADQFPTIDTKKLKEMWKGQQYNTDIDDLMGKMDVLGDTDESDG